MNKYIRIMRLDHWIKQLFILPGVVCAILLVNPIFDNDLLFKFVIGFIATCMIASANYVINEYLDAEFDKFHPTKKYRTVVSEGTNGKIVWLLWTALSIGGVLLSLKVNLMFLLMEVWLWLMGLLYNVKPFRTKDIAILDVLSESVNNMIRLLLGWFIITDHAIPPCSIILGYWMLGAFLMAIKRYAEYRMIDDKELAGHYRKSFIFYTENSLIVSAFFYAMCSIFFIGVFLVKYRVELVLFLPFLISLFCYYFMLSFKEDSSVQKPEKLYHEKKLMLYCAFLIGLFVVLMVVDIPILQIFSTNEIMIIK